MSYMRLRARQEWKSVRSDPKINVPKTYFRENDNLFSVIYVFTHNMRFFSKYSVGRLL
jgi:hypothetical protein